MAEFAVIRTSTSSSTEGMVFSGGNFLKPVTVNFSAIYVRHNGDAFLFDSGLGRQIDAQYEADMPHVKRPVFWYRKPVDPVANQLERASIAPPARIVLSHAHWDHASGLVDFPAADVWTTVAERDFMSHAHECGPIKRGSVSVSQISPPAIRWHEVTWSSKPHEGFDASIDVFGDGVAVLVPMPGHTPGSLGMFLTVGSGRRFFFCGDTVWNVGAIPKARPKMFVASYLVDSDGPATHGMIGRLRDLSEHYPDMTIVPAHDGAVQTSLGYFPNFIQ